MNILRVGFVIRPLSFEHSEEITYLEREIRNPDPGSKFEQYTQAIQGLSLDTIIPMLRDLGYGGLVAWDVESIIGSIFYQRHADHTLHMFSVKAEVPGRYIGPSLVESLLVMAYNDPEITGVKLGDGGNAKFDRYVKALAAGRISVPVPAKITEDAWVRFATVR